MFHILILVFQSNQISITPNGSKQIVKLSIDTHNPYLFSYQSRASSKREGHTQSLYILWFRNYRLVALKHGRNFIGIELIPDYIK